MRLGRGCKAEIYRITTCPSATVHLSHAYRRKVDLAVSPPTYRISHIDRLEKCNPKEPEGDVKPKRGLCLSASCGAFRRGGEPDGRGLTMSPEHSKFVLRGRVERPR